jgi:hypothetical protein
VIATLNSLNPYSSEPFGLQHFHRDDNQYLGGIALAPYWTDWVDSISECKIGLIDLNFSVEQVSARANHGTTQSVQHGPRRLITAKTKNALESQRTDPMLLAGDVPNGGESDAKFRSGFIKNGTSSYRCLMPACRTD